MKPELNLHVELDFCRLTRKLIERGYITPAQLADCLLECVEEDGEYEDESY